MIGIPPPALELSGIVKSYSPSANPVVSDVSLAIGSSEFVALIGESGSGKTTLLNIMGMLDTPTRGEVSIGGRLVGKLSETERALLRRDHIGFIFQFHYLVPGFSVLENAMMTLLMKGGRHPDQARPRIVEMLNQVGLGKHLNRRPDQLSGGQAQRVAIVRALANRPAIVLADEPTGNLDSKTAQEVFNMMRLLNREMGIAFVLVTHSGELARQCDRVISLADGMIVEPSVH